MSDHVHVAPVKTGVQYWLCRLSLVLLVIAITLSCACVRYHTRMFVEERPETVFNGYIVKPGTVAFKGSHRAKMKEPSDFGVWLVVRPADSSRAEDHRQEINALFHIDSCLLHFVETGEQVTLRVSAISYEYNMFYQGKVFRHSPTIIPNEVDTIDVTVPFYSLDSQGDRIDQDPIRSRMIRYESSGWGPLLD